MSRIEQLISEIEEYIDSCKFQALSNSKIIVNKEEMEELLVELRMRIPDEIKKYQKIISQQETILSDAQAQSESMLADAKKQSDSMIAQATEQANTMVEQATEQANSMVAQADAQTNEMVNDHEIMQRAYAHANEVVEQANVQAQAIVDAAVNDANNIRQGAIQYTDDMLRSLQNIMDHTMETAKSEATPISSSCPLLYQAHDQFQQSNQHRSRRRHHENLSCQFNFCRNRSLSRICAKLCAELRQICNADHLQHHCKIAVPDPRRFRRFSQQANEPPQRHTDYSENQNPSHSGKKHRKLRIFLFQQNGKYRPHQTNGDDFTNFHPTASSKLK